MKKLDVKNPGEEISEFMSTSIWTTPPDTTLQDAAQFMHSKDVGSLLVKEGKDYIGIVTERDFSRKAVAKGLDLKTARVAEVMSTPLLTLDCHERPVDANLFMAKHKIRHLPLTDEGKIVGLLSVRDLVHFYSNPRMRSW